VTKNPHKPDDAPEPEGGRAGQRLRDQMMGRFPGDTFPSPEGEESNADETPEAAGQEHAAGAEHKAEPEPDHT
jgi:hypothetical protein